MVFSILFLLSASLCCATTTVIDFNMGTPGVMIKYEYLDDSLQIGSFDSIPMVFDSGNPTCGQTNLGTPNSLCMPPGPGIGASGGPGMPYENCVAKNNILVSQAPDAVCTPSDVLVGNTTIIFEFTMPVRVEWIGLLDAYDSNSIMIKSYLLPYTIDVMIEEITIPDAMCENCYHVIPIAHNCTYQLHLSKTESVGIAEFGLTYLTLEDCPVYNTNTRRDIVKKDACDDCIVLARGGVCSALPCSGVCNNCYNKFLANDPLPGACGGNLQWQDLLQCICLGSGNCAGTCPGRCPTAAPTLSPTKAPTTAPTKTPTGAPTAAPTLAPTKAPTTSPTVSPTLAPTKAPTTAAPTQAPTLAPTKAPTASPTVSPTLAPSAAPTQTPTLAPTLSPTVSPTLAPTLAPSAAPTASPTVSPTLAPSAAPTQAPTASPTIESGSISGHVFFDFNGNGVQDVGEPDATENITVAITPASGPMLFTMLDANGNYNISGVPSGVATVNVVDPIGYVLTTANDPQMVTVPVFAVVYAGDVGFNMQACVAGRVYEDFNGNGVQDMTEMGISGLNVTLTDEFGTNYTVVTDVNGNWKLFSIPVGNATVYVDFTPLPSFTQTEGDNPTAITVVSNMTLGGIDGINFITSAPTMIPTQAPTVSPTLAPSAAPTVSPTLAPSATPTASPTVSPTLAPSASPTVSPTMSPTLAPSATPTVSPTMSPTLAPSAAPTVSPTQAPSAVPTVTPTVSPTLAPSAAPTVSPTMSPTLAPSASPTVSPTTAPTASPTIESGSISGHVFFDFNGNGVQDVGEPDATENITVIITPSSGPMLFTMLDANGNYNISGVPTGTASIDVVDPIGYVLTTANDPQLVTVPPFSVVYGGDVGFNMQACVAGRVYEDFNGNGVQDMTEMGISGLNVTLTDEFGVNYTVVTDVNGNWKLFSIPVGNATVYVDFTSLPSFTQTEGDNPTAIVVISNMTLGGIDGINFVTSAPTMSPTLAPSAAPTVSPTVSPTLAPSAAPTQAPTMSPTLAPSAAPTQAPTMSPTPAPSAAPTQAPTMSPTLAPSAAPTQAPTMSPTPAPTIQSGSISGHVFFDFNGNGVQDGGEPNGMENTTVIITPLGGGPLIFTMLDASGNYNVSGVPSGVATVNVVDPIGYALTTANDPQNVTVPAFDVVYAEDVGFNMQNCVAGRVYHDGNNCNGVQDMTDMGILGVNVTLADGFGQFYTTLTDSDGNWKLYSIPVGNATVTIDETTIPFQPPTQTEGDNPTLITVMSMVNATMGGVDGYCLVTEAPTPSPTVAPSASPSASPTPSPTLAPSASPSASPTPSPTLAPSASPSASPTPSPTLAPSASPTVLGQTFSPTEQNSLLWMWLVIALFVIALGGVSYVYLMPPPPPPCNWFNPEKDGWFEQLDYEQSPPQLDYYKMDVNTAGTGKPLYQAPFEVSLNRDTNTLHVDNVVGVEKRSNAPVLKMKHNNRFAFHSCKNIPIPLYVATEPGGVDFNGVVYPEKDKQKAFTRGMMVFNASDYDVGTTLYMRSPGIAGIVAVIEITADDVSRTERSYRGRLSLGKVSTNKKFK